MTDAIPLDRCNLLNSPDVHPWPVTTDITKIDWSPSGLAIEFTKKGGLGAWPPVPTDTPGDNYQFTLWVFLNIGSSWWGAGVIEFFTGQTRNGGPPDQIAANWYYDPLRWTPMTGHQPIPGEQVGFMVTSGDARHGDHGVGLHERSNIVALNFPGPAGGLFTFPTDTPAPAPGPTPAPAPTPEPTPTPPAPAALEDRVHELELRADQLTTDLDTFHGDVLLVSEALGLLRGCFAQIDELFKDWRP